MRLIRVDLLSATLISVTAVTKTSQLAGANLSMNFHLRDIGMTYMVARYVVLHKFEHFGHLMLL